MTNAEFRLAGMTEPAKAKPVNPNQQVQSHD